MVCGRGGCGKTSLGRAAIGLTPISSGSIFFGALQFMKFLIKKKKNIKKNADDFQDPYGSLNPRLQIALHY